MDLTRSGAELWKIARSTAKSKFVAKTRLESIIDAFIDSDGEDSDEEDFGVETTVGVETTISADGPTFSAAEEGDADEGETKADEKSPQATPAAIEPKKEKKKPATSHPRNAGKHTVLAFVNSGSGGGVGKTIFDDLIRHLGKENVFDLGSVGKGKMPEDHLEKYALDPFVRVLACGGDGTVGWIASSIDKVWKRVFEAERREARQKAMQNGGKRATILVQDTKFKTHLPIAVMPLGTGNDLSRQFGWGGAFQDCMRNKSMIQAVTSGRESSLDRWRCIVLPLERLDEEAKGWVPRMLGEKSLDDVADNEESTRHEVNLMEGLFKTDGNATGAEQAGAGTEIFDGVFCNYFSIGFDARIAFEFHKEREQHPEKFTSPTKNKIIYLKKSPGAYKRSPQLRGNIRMLVKNEEKNEVEELKIPKKCRAVILLNLQSYGGGNHLTSGDLNRADDGLIEVIFVSSVPRLAAAAGPIKLTVAARTSKISIRTDRALHCQVDGEPWYQGRSVIQIKHNSRNALLTKTREVGGGCCGPSNVVEG